MRRFLIVAFAGVFLTGCAGLMGGQTDGPGRLGDGQLTTSDFLEIAKIYMSIQSGGGAGALSGLLGGGTLPPPGLGVPAIAPSGAQALGAAADYVCNKMTVAEEAKRYGGSEGRKAACLALTGEQP